jgi:hypothetical protein
MSIPKQTLEGIVAGACRALKLDAALQDKFRVLVGGQMVGNRLQEEWYVPLQNVEATVNTKKAYELGLVRRCFGILRKNAEDKPVLFINEWSGKIDTSGDYRRVWQAEDDMPNRREMMAKFIASYQELETK